MPSGKVVKMTLELTALDQDSINKLMDRYDLDSPEQVLEIAFRWFCDEHLPVSPDSLSNPPLDPSQVRPLSDEVVKRQSDRLMNLGV